MIYNCIKQCIWIEWFAWYPVRVQGDKIAWLETVLRYHSKTASHPWQYKLKELS